MKCLLCQSEDQVDDRGAYPICASCHYERLECDKRIQNNEVLDRDASPLCTQCGLCCVVLSAAVTAEEIEELATWSNRLPSSIAMVEERPLGMEGELVLRRPCVFLSGKPLSHVNCQAYNSKRPSVCYEYHCKMAIRYRAGFCTLHEALFILRYSMTDNGRLSDFNWTAGGKKDVEDLRLAHILEAKHLSISIEDVIKSSPELAFAAFSRFCHKWEFASKAKEALFAAIMVNHGGDKLALDQFFAPNQMAEWTERDKEIALIAVKQVVSDFREMFTPA